MKRALPFMAALLISLQFTALDTIPASSKITSVVVYFSGAQVTRNVELKIKKGKHVILLNRLPFGISAEGIQVSVNQGCRLQSVKLNQIDEPADRRTAEEIRIHELISKDERRLKSIVNESQVFRTEEKLLLDNSLISKDGNSANVIQIRTTADFYRQRLNEIRQSQLRLNDEFEQLKLEIKALYAEMNRVTADRRKPRSQIAVLVECEKEGTASVQLSYFLPSAGWKPSYDFRVDEISLPLLITSHAEVYQSTGETWKEVKLKLSTHQPMKQNKTTGLQPWYIDRKTYTPVKSEGTGEPGAIRGVLIDEENGEVLPYANVVAYRDGVQVGVATTNTDGEFIIKPLPPGNYKIKAVFVGYLAREINNIVVSEGKGAFVKINISPSNSVSLETVVVQNYQVPLIDPDTRSGQTVTRQSYQNMAVKDVNSVAASRAGNYQHQMNMRGGRGTATEYFADGSALETIYYSDDPSRFELNTIEYDIDAPYTIPSDGADYDIRISETSVPASYIYHAIPKLDPEVVLIARIASWHNLRLLPAKANIYYQGTFTGHTMIDPIRTEDTLQINMGRDRDVVVNRSGRRQLHDRKSSSTVIKETVSWQIAVKNNKQSRIRVLVQDQYPLSERKSIETELTDAGNASLNEKTGIMYWDLNLLAGERTSLSYAYSIKYPRWARVITD